MSETILLILFAASLGYNLGFWSGYYQIERSLRLFDHLSEQNFSDDDQDCDYPMKVNHDKRKEKS